MGRAEVTEQIEAYSTQTDTRYASWEDLLKEEANGYSVVVIMQWQGPKKLFTYARTFGPYEDKQAAKRDQAKVKRRFKKWSGDEGMPREGVQLLACTVEPLWKEVFK